MSRVFTRTVSRLLLLFFYVFVVSCTTPPKRQQVVGFSFDADDNLFNLPTKIVVFDRQSGEEKFISTAEFASVRSQIGVAGTPWANYELRDSRKTGSMRYFGDEMGDGVNHFLSDLKKEMAQNPNGWKAPAFDSFVMAMSTPETAHQTTIITARGHEPETILAALAYLRDQGFFVHLPRAENIWTVSNPNFDQRFTKVFAKQAPEGGASSPSARKAAVMEELLDSISAKPLTAAANVMAPKGVGKGPFHLWGFSDDDYGNYQKAKQVIQKGLDNGRWGNIKVSLYYTGLHHATAKPHAVVLRPNQSPRPLLAAEQVEWRTVMSVEVAE